MLGKLFAAAMLALVLGSMAFAADEPNVMVTVKGALHEDKYGYFVQADGMTFDVVFSEAGRPDMQKFYSDLKGDWVKVTGSLYTSQTTNGKSRMTIYASDIAKNQPAAATVVVPEPAPPVIVREPYVERRSGIDVPFVHIHW